MRVTTSTGAKLGAVAGVVAYLIFAIIAVLGFAFASDKIWATLTDLFRQQAGANPDANMRQLLEFMKTADGRVFIATILMGVTFAVSLGLSTLGGAIASAVVKREQRH